MALFIKSQTIFIFAQLFLFILLIPSVRSITFNYPNFESYPENISFTGNASWRNGYITLTTNLAGENLQQSVGRATCKEPVHLWNSTTGMVADFTTHFTFRIRILDPTIGGGDGLAFFLAPTDSPLPTTAGGNIGLVNHSSDSSLFNSTDNPFVAIEFDTFPNPDWEPNSQHVGIDINSIRSVATWNTTSLNDDSEANVWVTFNSSTKNLSVYFTFAQDPVFNNRYLILSHVVDLKSILPELIIVGFSASTGANVELHNILSWEFNSTEFPSTGGGEGNSSVPGTRGGGNWTRGGSGGKDKTNIGLIIGSIVGGLIAIIIGVGLIVFVYQKKRNKAMKNEDAEMLEVSTDEDYEKGTGPKRFTYTELLRATKNFTEEGKLGEGGFGGVYRGILTDSNLDVAVKRVSSGSRQGKKEFVSEVKIISQLRHRNLVQLIGWCNERNEFLLVYEFMPNGSLDFHLFGGRTMLTWVLRYKIALGLASALFYLHEEWEQCVVHRDIKSSNIMLDSSFNAKLGDFGRARFVDHELGVKTTMIAGTTGYLAPECVVTGKAGKESDVYSFGVVALEIACGRRVVETREEPSKVGLVAWVWELYGSGRLLEAADTKMNMDFDEQQLTRLMVVGLWCANMDHTLRPSIKQAISVLNFEAPLPDLPLKMSVPTHSVPSLHDLAGFSYASLSSSGTNTQGNQSQTTSSNGTTNSRASASSSGTHTQGNQSQTSSSSDTTNSNTSASTCLLQSTP